MGQMKWIYSIIEDNRVEEFKTKYKKCLDNNELGLTFDGIFIDVIKAGSIIKVMEKGLKQYNEHLDEMADRHEAESLYWQQVQEHLNS